MKKLLGVFLLSFSLVSFGSTTLTNVKKNPLDNIELAKIKKSNLVIKLTKGNFFGVTSEFSELLMEDFVEKLMTHEDDNLILYFDSPGGSVFSLARMVSAMKASNIKFTCIARFAASAAFSLFQYCDNRYVLFDGVIMQHNWSGGFYDEAPRIKSLYETVDSIVKDIDAPVIKRMGLTKEEFYKKINNNMWLTAAAAVKNKAADAIALNVTCDKSLIKEKIVKTISERSFFGTSTRKVRTSACPLLTKTYPLNSNNNNNTEDEY